MLHAITVSATMFAQTVRDAANYASKDQFSDPGLSCIVLTAQAKTKTLTVSACDGKGYYERKLPLVWAKGDPKPSLPSKESRICIAAQDAAKIAKLIPNRSTGNVTLEVNDAISPKENHYQLTLVLPDGGTSTLLTPNDVTLPDYNRIVNRALKGKKEASPMQNLFLPIQELTRLAKVMPKKEGGISFYMAKEKVGGIVLLEYQQPEEDLDLRIIFMLSIMTDAA